MSSGSKYHREVTDIRPDFQRKRIEAIPIATTAAWEIKGWCPICMEPSEGKVVVDSGTICEDGTEAIALRIVRPYMGMRCEEMTYIPKGSKWIYGCNVKAKGPAPKPI